MSKYTTEVRYLCESLTGLTESSDYPDIDDIIEAAVPIIFSFDFPIFDEEYREVLCTKILRHYYTREIGLETYALWKLKLQTKLNEIMPFYNKLYESELLTYNPLYDVDMTTTNVGTRTGESNNLRTDARTGVTASQSTRQNTGARNNESEVNDSTTGQRSNQNIAQNNISNTSSSEDSSKTSSNTSNSNVNRDLYSDTPQGALNGVENQTYLTNARKVTDENTGVAINRTESEQEGTETGVDRRTENSFDNEQSTRTGTTTAKETTSDFGQNRFEEDKDEKENSMNVGHSRNTEDYVLHVVGKSAGANYSKMIKEFRDTFLNIDMDIINDLAELFMLIW